MKTIRPHPSAGLAAAIATVLLIAGGTAAATPPPQPAGNGSPWTPVTVVYLSDSRGMLDVCGCKSMPRGGVVRRATYMNALWNEGITPLLIEGGDLFGKRGEKGKQDTEFLCEQTAAFGTDAIGLGEMDLNYGLAFLRQMIATYELPFTSANVRDAKSGQLLLPEYLVVEKNGIKFGIVSVLDPEKKIVTMNAEEPEFRVDDPVATLRLLLPRLRALCDTVVLVAHTGEQSLDVILKGVEGIDIAVVGHAARSLETERILNDAIVLSAIFEGRFIGRADLGIDPATGTVHTVRVRLTGLDASVADDPSMAAKLAQYKASHAQAGSVPTGNPAAGRATGSQTITH